MRRDAISLKLYAAWVEALQYANFCADEFARSGEECLFYVLWSAAESCNQQRKEFERYCGLVF